jgi:hypothetical protein
VSNSLLVMCPCGVPFAVASKWLKEHPTALWECQGMIGTKGNYRRCGRKYSAATLEKELWRETWDVEKEGTK